MPRLTREESRAQTRQRLIEAAADVFAAKGFAAASLEEIADAAGYSRGAVYSNYANKDELFVAVMAHRREARYDQIAEVIRAHPDPGALFDAIQSANRTRTDARQWFLLSVEFFLYAMRKPAVQPALAEHERILRREMAEGIAAVLKPLGVRLPVPVEDASAIVQALDYGLLFQHYIEPDAVPERLYFDALTLLLSAVSARPQ